MAVGRNGIPIQLAFHTSDVVNPKTLLRFEELTDLISDIEIDGKCPPILLKHYLKLGAQVIAFNQDPKFSRVVDALVLVDLETIPDHICKRYLGESASNHFAELHSTVLR